ncbi:hypothetical protein PCG10_003483 [Penicillium crustosum]|uniref:Uncharacterized protein n=1 Tax=Penicillium crustosum TaxID=36656 RepID=A0A9P5GR20_PENCR|nr:hypothetical protein PCG10_003483 [Penicillium crustosum]
MSPTASKASSEERRSQSSVDESEIQRAQSRRSQREGAVNSLDHVRSHVSHHDMVANDDFQEVDAEQYLRFSPARKMIIVGVLSFCSFLAPISSTSILAAIPEVAKTYNTTGSVINASNALYMAFMGIAAPFWGPFSQVWGRRPGVIVTFRSWRVIFWLQTALGGCGTLLVFFFFPETYPHLTKGDMAEKTTWQKTKYLWHRISPLQVAIMLFKYPNLFCTGLAAGALVWNQYSLLTPIRYVLNPRFHLTSPIQTGLFYIAPGCGYLVGTLMGGRWADHTVKKWIAKRGGVRVPEDRLKSCLIFLGGVIPGCILIYGWTVEKAVGGIPVPVLAMFFQGVAQLFCFPSLNTYSLDVMQSSGRSAEVVAGSYLVRYVFGALGSGLVLPAVESMGVGWFSTISALFLVVSGVGVWLTTVFGDQWRDKVDKKSQRKGVENTEKIQEGKAKAEA